MDSLFKNTEIIKEEQIELSDIRYKEIENKEFLINNKLLVNSEKGNLLNELKRCLSECEKFYFSVAFINFSGIQLLLDSFKDLNDKGIRGKILTSTLPPGNSHMFGRDITGERRADNISLFSFSITAPATFISFFIFNTSILDKFITGKI